MTNVIKNKWKINSIIPSKASFTRNCKHTRHLNGQVKNKPKQLISQLFSPYNF